MYQFNGLEPGTWYAMCVRVVLVKGSDSGTKVFGVGPCKHIVQVKTNSPSWQPLAVRGLAYDEAKADYKTGFIGIYNTSKRRLQPVALNSGLFWQKGLKIIKRGHIIIEFLPQIDIGLDKTEVLNKVENSIESATNKLLN